ncbi:MAG: hypothetical protein KF713_11735 [Turneriella sp.]|nr:hypothetical protein [Turneriella sp.]
MQNTKRKSPRALYFAVVAGVFVLALFAAFFWAHDIDTRLAERRRAAILAPLNKKIAAAEIAGLAAAKGLKDQREKILQSVAEPAKFPGGYHAYLLAENRIYVERLRKVREHPFSAVADGASVWLNPVLRLLFDRDADRWSLFGFIGVLLAAVSGILYYRAAKRHRAG